MTNPFFNPTSVPASNAQGRSETVRSELASIGAGFDAVNAAIALLLTKTNPSSTGSFTHAGGPVNFAGATQVTVPAVSDPSDNSNKAAPTSFVQLVLGASGTLIPAQAGQAGKVLMTNGVSYSWQLRLPAQAGQAGKALKTDGTTDAWSVINPLTGGGIQLLAASGALAADKRWVEFTVATAGTVLSLPDATTLQQGDSVIASFNSSAAASTQGVADATGDLLLSKVSANVNAFLLYDNSTTAGVWKVWTPSGTLPPAATGAAFLNGAETVLRSNRAGPSAAVALGSDTFLVANPNSGASTEFFVLTATGNALSIGSITTSSTGTVVWSRLFAVSGGFVYVCLNSASGGTLSVIGLTVSGTTVTASAVTTVATSVNAADGFLNLAADVSGNVLFVGYTTASAIAVRAVALSGSSAPTVGSATTIVSTTASFAVTLLAQSINAFFIGYSTDDTTTRTTKGMIVSVLSTTCTTNTAYDIASSSTVSADMAVAQIDSTRLLFAHMDFGPSTVKVRVLTLTGTAIATGADTDITTSGFDPRTFGLTPRQRISIAAAGSYFAVLSAQTGAAKWRARVVSVSSTTVSTNGSEIGATSAPGHMYAYCLAAVNGRVFLSAQSSAGYTMYDVGASGFNSGVGPTLSAVQSYESVAASPFEGALPMAFKLSAGKYWLVMSINTANFYAVSTRYGGIPA